MNPLTAAIAFGTVFLAELPDKTALAALTLGSRYKPLPVVAGASAAFTLHVLLAILAAQLLTLLPHRLLTTITAAVFLLSAVVLFRYHHGSSPAPDGSSPARDGSNPAPDGSSPAPDGSSPARDGSNPAPDGSSPAPDGSSPARDGSSPAPGGSSPAPGGSSPVPGADAGLWRVGVMSFGAVLVAEFGDLTQVVTANLAVKYNSRFSVGLGALLALCSVAAIAAFGGRALARFIPLRLVSRIAALVMLALGIGSAIAAFHS